MTRYRTIVADPPWPIPDFPQWFASGHKGTVARPYDVMTIAEIAALPVRDLSDNMDGDAHLYLWAIDQFLDEAFDVARAWGFHHSATLVWCKPQRPGGLGGVFPSNVEFVLYCRRPKSMRDSRVEMVTRWLNDQRKRAGITLRQLEDAGFTEGQLVHWTRKAHSVGLSAPSPENWARLKDVIGFGDEMDELVSEIAAIETPRLVRSDGRWFTWPIAAHSSKPEAFLDLVEQVSPGPYLELFARRQRLGWDTWGDEAFNHVELSS